MISATLSNHSKAVVSVKFNPSINHSQLFVTSSSDKKACVYKALTGELVRTLSEHTLGLNGCEWLHNGKHLVTFSDDKLIKLWDVEYDKCLSTLAGCKSFVYSLAVHPLTDILVSGSYDGNIHVMDVRCRINATSFLAHTKPVTSVGCTEDNCILSGSFDGFSRLWDLSTNLDSCPCISSIYDTEFTPISCATFSPNNKYVLLSRLDNRIGLYSLLPNKRSELREFSNCVKEFVGHTNMKYCINNIICNKGGQSCVVSGSEDNKIYIWNINNSSKGSDIDATRPDVCQVLTGHQDAVLAVDYSEFHQILVSGSKSGHVVLHALDDTSSINDNEQISSEELDDRATANSIEVDL